MNLQKSIQILVLSLFSITNLAWTVSPQAGIELENDELDDALLLMITANVRLLADEDDLPVSGGSYKEALLLQSEFMQVSRRQVNEQRVLADYYLRYANSLPADHPKLEYFIARSYAHSQMADILQRRRNRQNNPFQKVGRVLIQPFKFAAGEVFKLIRKGVELVKEVGPEIIREMVNSYLTTGQPINVKVFFNKLKDVAFQRFRTALENKLANRIAGFASGSNRQPIESTPTSELDGTEQVPTVTPSEPKEYGQFEIKLTAEMMSAGVVDLQDYWVEIIPANTECAFPDYMVYFETLNLPLKIDLDEGTIEASLSGKATDELPPNEVTIPAWFYEAEISGQLVDAWIAPEEDLTGWYFEGEMDVSVHPGGKMQCFYYPPGFPEVEAERVWLVPDRAFELSVAFVGTIDQQKMKDGESVITPGGSLSLAFGLQELEEGSSTVYVEYQNVAVPGNFPPP